ncbi:MAG: glycosyltransferase [Blautia sp.]|nr:glycosyltransferase [Blautia sp.]MCM1200951.1 glycosyltransferase [Bacteroides fragilis]
MNSVDIIIPIYNAFEDLEICLNSLYQYTDLKQNRLILINDNSPDERIRPFLDKQARENVIVIHNEINRGFSNNINIGMAQSGVNDVILLNSDTILTSNWVEKMMECAYSSKEIGTVTPLSNNATLCSVPELFEENELPPGMNVDQAAEIVEQCSLKKYPQISVAHGFCMLVKREVIKLIGDFDAETFGRGYGEENDFCNRAEQMGYIHVMCDNTYIYHSGTRSFVSKEKEKYIEAHQKVLYDRYPKQMKANEMHIGSNPNQLIGKNIERFWAVNNGKRNILYVLQSDFRKGAENNVGGTQMHVKHLTEGLKNSNNIFVAAINGSYLQFTAYIEQEEYIYRFFVGEKASFFRFRDRNFARIFKEIYTAFQIELVHVHHLLSLSLDIIYEANKLEIPVIFTIHDFWSVCPNITLRNTSGLICMKEEDNRCRECLSVNAKIYEKNSYIELWRGQLCEALSLCEALVVPSESAKEIIGNYYPDLKSKIRIISHGLDIGKQMKITDKYLQCENIYLEKYSLETSNECLVLKGQIAFRNSEKVIDSVYIKVESGNETGLWIPAFLEYGLVFKVNIPVWRIEKEKYKLTVYVSEGESNFYEIKEISGRIQPCLNGKDKFHVAFIGGISEIKGAKQIKKIIEKSSKNTRWFIIGDIGDADLLQYENSRLIKVGKYKQENLNLILNAYQIDIIGILSILPETFSYTLSEALGMSRPVFVTDIGALGERVRKTGIGKAVPVNNIVEEVLSYLDGLMSNVDLYQNEVEKCKRITLKTQEEMCKEYQVLYEKYLKEKAEYDKNSYDKEFIWRGMEAGVSDNKYVPANQMSAAELKYVQNIQDSLTWRIVVKLINIKFPFKDKIYHYLISRKNRNG